MAFKRNSFNDWLGDLREVVMSETDLELEDFSQYYEDEAYNYFTEGLRPKKYMTEVLLGEIVEIEDEDLTDVFKSLRE